MEPGELFFHGIRYLTGNQLRWKKMPHVFDHFCFPDFQVDVPSSPEEYRSHLKSLFPNEQRVIDRYFDDLLSFRKKINFVWAPKIMPIFIAKLIRPFFRLFLWKIPEQSTDAYFERIGCSEKLKAAICAPWGTFGALPSECSIYEHWITLGSYLYGAWYPAGGATSISESLNNFIENKGGLLRTNSGVKDSKTGIRRSYQGKDDCFRNRHSLHLHEIAARAKYSTWHEGTPARVQKFCLLHSTFCRTER